MDKFDRIYKLHELLRERRTPISREELVSELELKAESSIYRLIRVLKDQLHKHLRVDQVMKARRISVGKFMNIARASVVTGYA